MTLPALTDDDIKKIKKLLDEGCRVYSDIDALREGLKETVDAISEELDIPKKVLNKAIRSTYKEDIISQKEEINEVEELLNVMNK